jgi:hypothetical protein
LRTLIVGVTMRVMFPWRAARGLTPAASAAMGVASATLCSAVSSKFRFR